jgi:hypothetical protein
MKRTTGLRPGSVAPASGQYEIIGPRGGRTHVERTISKGERLPPPLEPGQTFTLVDPTKNNSGRS